MAEAEAAAAAALLASAQQAAGGGGAAGVAGVGGVNARVSEEALATGGFDGVALMSNFAPDKRSLEKYQQRRARILRVAEETLARRRERAAAAAAAAAAAVGGAASAASAGGGGSTAPSVGENSDAEIATDNSAAKATADATAEAKTTKKDTNNSTAAAAKKAAATVGMGWAPPDLASSSGSEADLHHHHNNNYDDDDGAIYGNHGFYAAAGGVRSGGSDPLRHHRPFGRDAEGIFSSFDGRGDFSDERSGNDRDGGEVGRTTTGNSSSILRYSRSVGRRSNSTNADADGGGGDLSNSGYDASSFFGDGVEADGRHNSKRRVRNNNNNNAAGGNGDDSAFGGGFGSESDLNSTTGAAGVAGFFGSGYNYFFPSTAAPATAATTAAVGEASAAGAVPTAPSGAEVLFRNGGLPVPHSNLSDANLSDASGHTATSSAAAAVDPAAIAEAASAILSSRRARRYLGSRVASSAALTTTMGGGKQTADADDVVNALPLPRLLSRPFASAAVPLVATADGTRRPVAPNTTVVNASAEDLHVLTGAASLAADGFGTATAGQPTTDANVDEGGTYSAAAIAAPFTAASAGGAGAPVAPTATATDTAEYTGGYAIGQEEGFDFDGAENDDDGAEEEDYAELQKIAAHYNIVTDLVAGVTGYLTNIEYYHPHFSPLRGMVLRRWCVEVFNIWFWFSIVSVPEVWFIGAVAIIALVVGMRIFLPPRALKSKLARFTEPFLAIPNCTKYDTMVWFASYIGDVIVFTLLLPIVGGFMMQYAAGPFLAMLCPFFPSFAYGTHQFAFPSSADIYAPFLSWPSGTSNNSTNTSSSSFGGDPLAFAFGDTSASYVNLYNNYTFTSQGLSYHASNPPIFYVPTVWSVACHWAIGSLCLVVLVRFESLVMHALFASGVDLFFVRSVALNAVNDDAFSGWKFAFAQIYDSDPLRLFLDMFRVGIFEVGTLVWFVRYPVLVFFNIWYRVYAPGMAYLLNPLYPSHLLRRSSGSGNSSSGGSPGERRDSEFEKQQPMKKEEARASSETATAEEESPETGVPHSPSSASPPFAATTVLKRRPVGSAFADAAGVWRFSFLYQTELTIAERAQCGEDFADAMLDICDGLLSIIVPFEKAREGLAGAAAAAVMGVQPLLMNVGYYTSAILLHVGTGFTLWGAPPSNKGISGMDADEDEFDDDDHDENGTAADYADDAEEEVHHHLRHRRGRVPLLPGAEESYRAAQRAAAAEDQRLLRKAATASSPTISAADGTEAGPSSRSVASFDAVLWGSQSAGKRLSDSIANIKAAMGFPRDDDATIGADDGYPLSAAASDGTSSETPSPLRAPQLPPLSLLRNASQSVSAAIRPIRESGGNFLGNAYRFLQQKDSVLRRRGRAWRRAERQKRREARQKLLRREASSSPSSEAGISSFDADSTMITSGIMSPTNAIPTSASLGTSSADVIADSNPPSSLLSRVAAEAKRALHYVSTDVFGHRGQFRRHVHIPLHPGGHFFGLVVDLAPVLVPLYPLAPAALESSAAELGRIIAAVAATAAAEGGNAINGSSSSSLQSLASNATASVLSMVSAATASSPPFVSQWADGTSPSHSSSSSASAASAASSAPAPSWIIDNPIVGALVSLVTLATSSCYDLISGALYYTYHIPIDAFVTFTHWYFYEFVCIFLVAQFCVCLVMYPTQWVALRFLRPLSEALATATGTRAILFDEERLRLLDDWLAGTAQNAMAAAIGNVQQQQQQQEQQGVGGEAGGGAQQQAGGAQQPQQQIAGGGGGGGGGFFFAPADLAPLVLPDVPVEVMFTRREYRLDPSLLPRFHRARCFVVGLVFFAISTILCWTPVVVCSMFLFPILCREGTTNGAMLTLWSFLFPFVACHPRRYFWTLVETLTVLFTLFFFSIYSALMVVVSVYEAVGEFWGRRARRREERSRARREAAEARERRRRARRRAIEESVVARRAREKKEADDRLRAEEEEARKERRRLRAEEAEEKKRQREADEAAAAVALQRTTPLRASSVSPAPPPPPPPQQPPLSPSRHGSLQNQHQHHSSSEVPPPPPPLYLMPMRPLPPRVNGLSRESLASSFGGGAVTALSSTGASPSSTGASVSFAAAAATPPPPPYGAAFGGGSFGGRPRSGGGSFGSGAAVLPPPPPPEAFLPPRRDKSHSRGASVGSLVGGAAGGNATNPHIAPTTYIAVVPPPPPVGGALVPPPPPPQALAAFHQSQQKQMQQQQTAFGGGGGALTTPPPPPPQYQQHQQQLQQQQRRQQHAPNSYATSSSGTSSLSSSMTSSSSSSFAADAETPDVSPLARRSGGPAVPPPPPPQALLAAALQQPQLQPQPPAVPSPNATGTSSFAFFSQRDHEEHQRSGYGSAHSFFNSAVADIPTPSLSSLHGDADDNGGVGNDRKNDEGKDGHNINAAKRSADQQEERQQQQQQRMQLPPSLLPPPPPPPPQQQLRREAEEHNPHQYGAAPFGHSPASIAGSTPGTSPSFSFSLSPADAEARAAEAAAVAAEVKDLLAADAEMAAIAEEEAAERAEADRRRQRRLRLRNGGGGGANANNANAAAGGAPNNINNNNGGGGIFTSDDDDDADDEDNVLSALYWARCIHEHRHSIRWTVAAKRRTKKK